MIVAAWACCSSSSLHFQEPERLQELERPQETLQGGTPTGHQTTDMHMGGCLHGEAHHHRRLFHSDLWYTDIEPPAL